MVETYAIRVTQEEADFILQALAKFPFEQVYSLISSIGGQVQAQKDPNKDK